MLSVLRNRNFTLLWVGGLISQIGDWALFIGLPMYVFRLTGSTLATSGAFLSEIVPSLVLGTVAGVFVDRWDRRKTIIVANVFLTAGLLPLLAVRSSGDIWIVYAVAFAQAITSQFLVPAWNALLPLVVGPDDLVSANSLRSLNSNVARLVGPAIGGLASAAGSLSAAALIDSGSFLVVALMTVAVTGIVTSPRTAPVDQAGALRSFFRELIEGLAVVRESRTVAVLAGSFIITSLGEGVFGVMFVVWVRQVMHGGSLQLGWFMSAQAIGGILGGLAVAHLGRRLPPVPILGLCSIVFGLMDILLFTYPLFLHGIALGLGIIIIVGFPAAAVGATWNSLLQMGVDDARRGRVFGLMGALSSGSTLVGTIVAGTLGGILGPIFLLNTMQGGVYLVAGVLVLVTLRHAWTGSGVRVFEGRAAS